MGPDQVHVGWTEALAAAMKPFASPGIYLNFLADGDSRGWRQARPDAGKVRAD